MNQSVVKKKILFIINPKSGTRFKGGIAGIIRKYADPTIFDVEIVITRYKGEATEIVSQKLAENYRYFVAVGGDGTVNEIAKALINSEAVLGLIPAGSGNGLARHLNIPMEPKKAVQIINQLKIDPIDYGIINDIPFFCTCGVGFDALISEKFDQNRGRGFSNYIKLTLTEYFNYQPEYYSVTIDNEEKKNYKAFLITFANASQYGNNARIAPGADIRDGKLDICIVSPFPLYKAPWIGIRLFSGNLDRSTLVFTRQAGKIMVERGSAGAIHIDGESCQLGKNLSISLINKGLRVIVP